MNNIPFKKIGTNSKNKIFIIFLGFILLSSLTPLQSINAASVTIPESAINLSDFASDNSITPDIDSSGDNVYVVWREANDIRFHKSTDAGTTFPGTPIDIGDTTTDSPKITVNGENIYSVWREGQAIKFNDSNDGGVTFAGATVEVSSDTSTSNRDPQITSSDSGAVHVVWRDRSASTDNSILYLQSQDNGTSFNSIVVIDPDSDSSNPLPQVATSGSSVHVVWQDSDNVLVASSSNDGSTFPSVVDVGDTESQFLTSGPQIAVDDNGNVYVVWQDVNEIKAAIKKPGQLFGTPDVIGNTLVSGAEKQIVTSGDKAFVVWQEGDVNVAGDIQFAKSDNGEPFGDVINISESLGVSVFPQIAASGSNVFVVWEDRTLEISGEILIKASSDSGSTFSSGLGDNISSTSGKTSTDPAVSASGTNAYVSWRDFDPGNNDILFKTVTRSGLDINFDSGTYKLGDTATITVDDPSSSDSIEVDVTSTSDSTGITITLPETDPGIFSDSITFTETGDSSGTELLALPGELITATFSDSSGTSKIESRQVLFSSAETDLCRIAHVKVIDQNSNLNENVQETVEVAITSVTNPEGTSLILTETGVNTGEFSSFKDSEETQSKLIFNDLDPLVPFGISRFEPQVTSISINATDRRDLDNANENPTIIDPFNVFVNSTSDPAGITVILNETDVNTADFTGELFVSSEASDSETSTIKIAQGDFISVFPEGNPGLVSHLLVTTSDPEDGAIEVAFPDIDNEVESVQASYKTAEDNTDVTKACLVGGGGGGGLVRPSLVVNLLAGVPGSGGDFSAPISSLRDQIQYSITEFPLEVEEMVLNYDSSIPLPPLALDLFDDFNYPLTINDKGFVVSGFSSIIETQTLKTNSTNTIKLVLFETTNIQHISLYTNLRGVNTEIHQSDTQILYNDGLPLQVIDANGLFKEVSVTINDIDENFKEVVFEIIFEKSMEKSDFITRSWDRNLNSYDAYYLDAIEVVPKVEEVSPIPTFEDPVVEELKSQIIPIWIKNNAAWWSDQQIGDSDFVSGIEYLIKNGIIHVPGIEVNSDSASTEIPDWIKNNAGWWADSLITDGDFIEAMQWLVAKGVIQI